MDTSTIDTLNSVDDHAFYEVFPTISLTKQIPKLLLSLLEGIENNLKLHET